MELRIAINYDIIGIGIAFVLIYIAAAAVSVVALLLFANAWWNRNVCVCVCIELMNLEQTQKTMLNFIVWAWMNPHGCAGKSINNAMTCKWIYIH